MQTLSFTDHLTAAAAAGIELPTFYQRDGVTHYRDCHGPGYQHVVAPNDPSLAFFSVGECSECWSDTQQSPEGIASITALLQLQDTARTATYLAGRVADLATPDFLSDLQNQGARYDDWLEEFSSNGSELRRTGLTGRSSLEGNNDEAAPTTPFRDFAAAQASALSQQWHDVTAGAPIREHILTHRSRTVPRGAFSPRSPQTTEAVRAVRADTLHFLFDPGDGTLVVEGFALFAESTALAAHGDWEVIAWDTRLDKWTPSHAVATGDYTADELQLALSLYAGAQGAPLQGLLDAVRASHRS